ncbi:rhamnosyltransferase WsaF family glycosyltransferase [Actibacterium lipolyticum]|uniref:Glycosyltransferase 2-like domain-containing protein n=1 Tax=Actibacterium lipolyticum TaxID=1524263 RepID=A0A238KUE4_9RHOB|nr:hypothetical protein [Actibacterium lipolyticum]SMX46419.1 hypothetical protein COL8621_03107 [Actibacterium lipolyticum]
MTDHILIILPVFQPNEIHFRAQLASIARQTHQAHSVLFVVADTVSNTLIDEAAKEAGLAYDIATPADRLDAVRAFEFGLATGAAQMPGTNLFALCDQDDIWHPDKLATSLSEMRAKNADLVHSDARVVDENGDLLHQSLFRMERRDKLPGLRGLLYRNNVTGMTVLMTRRVVEAALPFPPQDGVHFYHDLWLALVATVLSKVAFVDAQLVDYRQHAANAVGAITHAAENQKFGRVWLRRRAASYALAMYLARSLVLRLGHGAEEQTALKKLKPFLSPITIGPRFVADSALLALRGHASLARTALHFALIATGRSVWALKNAMSGGVEGALKEFDARVYALSPGPLPQAASPEIATPEPAANWAEKIDQRTKPKFTPVMTADAPVMNILVPTLNPAEIFAGIVTALDFGTGLAERGVPVRFIATDLPIAAPSASLEFILQRVQGSADRMRTSGRISIQCGCNDRRLVCHPQDRFFATAWWTAHQANHILQSGRFSQTRFHYLIQDFEPNFYPWGAEYAGAMESYAFDFHPIFNTSLLRDYFAEHGFTFAGPSTQVFRPSIDISRYADLPSKRRPDHKLIALYGRPEVARNMFPVAVDALSRFLRDSGLKRDDVSVVSVGLKHGDIELPGNIRLRSLGKLPWSDYPSFLSTVDLGLSLMYSPHPSHLPIEMAAAGANVVTNSFGPKDLSQLSPAIISGAPTAPALTAALKQAWAAPAPDASSRQIDLSPMGWTLDATVEQLASHLHEGWNYKRRCA